MLKLLNHIDTITSAIPVKCRYEEKKVFLKNHLCFKIIGDINSEKILICLHGMGGSKDANYINSLINCFMDEFNGCVIAPDMPGVNDSINTEYFWGIQKKVADVYIDDILEYINFYNVKAKIFIVGFSGGAGATINYLTDTGNIIKNTNKNLITHSYFVSPAGPYLNCLIYIRDKSIFNSYISLYHTGAQFRFLLNKGDFKMLSRFNKDRISDIVISSIWANGNDEYKFNFNSKVENCDVLISKHDPVTNYDTVIDFFSSLDGVNIIQYFLGGHVGFFDIFDKKRKYESYIINSIKDYDKTNK